METITNNCPKHNNNTYTALYFIIYGELLSEITVFDANIQNGTFLRVYVNKLVFK